MISTAYCFAPHSQKSNQAIGSHEWSVVVRRSSPALEVGEQSLCVSPYDSPPLPVLAEALSPCWASSLNFLQLCILCFDWLCVGFWSWETFWGESWGF